MSERHVKLLALDGPAPETSSLWQEPLEAVLAEGCDWIARDIADWSSSQRARHWTQLRPELHFFVDQNRSKPPHRLPGGDYQKGSDVVDCLGAIIEAEDVLSAHLRAKKLQRFCDLCARLGSTKDAEYLDLGFMLLVAGPVRLTTDVYRFEQELRDNAEHLLYSQREGDAAKLLRVESVFGPSELRSHASSFLKAAISKYRAKARS